MTKRVKNKNTGTVHLLYGKQQLTGIDPWTEKPVDEVVMLCNTWIYAFEETDEDVTCKVCQHIQAKQCIANQAKKTIGKISSNLSIYLKPGAYKALAYFAANHATKGTGLNDLISDMLIGYYKYLKKLENEL